MRVSTLDTCETAYAVRRDTYSKQVLDLGGMHSLEWQFKHPEEEKGEEVARADAGARREVVRHILPRIAKDTPEDDTQVLGAEVGLHAEPDDGDDGADPDKEVLPVHAKDAAGEHWIADMISSARSAQT